MKPAFPKWLRRIDPLLAREDDNLLFQFFRERRARRRGLVSWMARSPSFLPMIIFTVLAFSSIPLMNTSALAWNLAIFSGLGFVGYGCLLGYRLIYPRIEQGKISFPERISTFFPAGRIRTGLFRDLWLTETSGKDFAEAMYLESVEYVRRPILWIAAALPIMVLALYFYSAKPTEAWLLLGSALLLSIAVSAYAAVMLILSGTYKVESLCWLWLKHVDYREFTKKLALAMLIEGVVTLVVLVMLVLVLVRPIVLFLSTPFHSTEQWEVDAQILTTRLALCAFAIGTAAYPLTKWVILQRDKTIAQATLLFDPFFRRGVMQDDDAGNPDQ